MLFTKCGSPGYTAPEILRGFGYSLNSDIFSLGAVFFNLLTGCYLFSGETNEEVLRKNKICDIKDILKNLSNLPDLKVSESCIEALCLMLITDPKKRPQACELLNHRWFKSNLDAIVNLLAQNHSIAIQSCNKSLFVNDNLGTEKVFNVISSGLKNNAKVFNFNQSFAPVQSINGWYQGQQFNKAMNNPMLNAPSVT